MSHNWVCSSSFQNVPPASVLVGVDSDGDAIYVGRVRHEGDLLPAKIVPAKRTAYVAYNGTEHMKQSYEVLVGSGYSWKSTGGGSIAANSVIGGKTRDGETLYIGRASYEGSLTPGKIHPSHGCLYIPYGGREISIKSYECLVKY